MKIESGVSVRDIKQRIGVGQDEELRESEKRRAYLQKFARIITTERPSLRFAPNFPTAAVNQEQDHPRIMMTTREFNQPVTDLSRRVFDMMMQEALTVHELGHILYTNHGSFKSYLGKVDMEKKSMFKAIWNTLEDGAIERQLRERFNVEDELYVLNANLMTKDEFGHEIDENTQRFSLFQAVKLGLSDMAVYDSGEFKKLRDASNGEVKMASAKDEKILENLIPEMKSVSQDVLTEPSSEARNQRIYDFWDNHLEPALDNSDVSGQSQSNLDNLISEDGSIGGGGGQSQSGGEDGEQDESAQPVSGKPDDTESDVGDDSEDASSLGYDENQEAVEAVVEVAAGDGSEEQEEMAEEEQVGGGGDGDEDGDEEGDSEGDESGQSGGLDEGEVEAERQEALAAEAQELDGGEARMEEVEEFLQVIEEADADAEGGSGAGGGWRGLSMDVPEGGEHSEDRWSSAKTEAKKLKRILRNRLRENQRTKTKRNQRRGSFDRRNIVNAARGSPRVFQRDEESNEKEYDCIIVLDRSGSMSGHNIEQAEVAVGALTNALHDVGVNTSVIGMHRNEAQLELAFGEEPELERGNLASGLAGGGTPLSKAIHLARRRVEDQDTNPFMIVVTDGRPNNQEKYLEELDKATFPVLGVITTSQHAVEGGRHEEESQFYHRHVLVTGEDELSDSLLNLAQEVMF